MKDEQGASIINPETIKIIRNLREKANHEQKSRDFYIDRFIVDTVIKMSGEKLTAMAAMEKYGQQWCLENGIIGFDYITNVTVGAKGETK